MTKTTETTKIHQSLDRKTDFATQVALNFEVSFHTFANFRNMCISELIGTKRNRQIGILADLLRSSLTDAINVRQSDADTLVTGKINTSNTSHGLTLPLLVLGVFANHANYALALDNFAFVADPLYGRTNLHFRLQPGTFR